MSKIAFVMGRNYSARLGMIRAAGEAGYRIIDIQTKPKNAKEKIEKFDSCSKYTEKTYMIPQTTHEALIDLVIRVTPETAEGKIILLPTDDFSAAAIDTQQDRLRERYLFPFMEAGKDALVSCMNKKVQKELARKAGMNTVETWELLCRDGRYVIPDDISYPVFIKPETSFLSVKSIMQKCENREVLEKALEKIAEQTDAPILAEEYAEIEKEFDVPGFACRDIIHTPGMIEKEIIHMGVTATGTIYPMNQYEGMEELIRTFMQQFGFTGLFDLEMYLSRGRIYFNELNLRFGASGFAMTGSGINMPAMLIDALHGERIPSKLPRIEKRSFMSEKACLASYANNSTSWKKYKERLKTAEIHFIQNKDDPRPWAEFRKHQTILHMKKTVKEFRKKNTGKR